MTDFIYLTRRQVLAYRMKQHRAEDSVVLIVCAVLAILVLFGWHP